MSLTFDTLTRDVDLRRLEPEWLELFGRSQTQNPFAHPAWVLSWLAGYAPTPQARLVVTARQSGELVCVAPFYRRAYGVGPVKAACLQLVGSSPGPDDPLTEMCEILVLPDGRRRLIRGVLHHLIADHAGAHDWIGLSLPPQQGWFDDEWLPDAWRKRGAYAVHKDVRPFVVLPLPSSWEELTLKRNLKEAIRRSKNRLAALDPPPQVVLAEGEAVLPAVDRIQELHRQRALLRGHIDHDDYFDDAVTMQLAHSGAAGLAQSGHAAAALLEIGDRPVAGRLLLRANGSVFLSFSGADPDYWALGASTSLIVACIRQAIERGDRLLNLSLNPDGAKLRWSEQLELHNEFIAVGPSRRAQRLFELFWHARANRALARQRDVFRRRNGAMPRQPDATVET